MFWGQSYVYIGGNGASSRSKENKIKILFNSTYVTPRDIILNDLNLDK